MAEGGDAWAAYTISEEDRNSCSCRHDQFHIENGHWAPPYGVVLALEPPLQRKDLRLTVDQLTERVTALEAVVRELQARSYQ